MPYADPEVRRAYHKQYRLKHPEKEREHHERERISGYWCRFNKTPARRERCKGYSKKRIAFGRTKRVFMDENPRTGICSECGRKVGEEIKITHMHHSKGYFIIFPWFGIKELCGRCHIKIARPHNRYQNGV